jgi:4-diphosphocytidyl-2-C-methyl-D-erythritol kinase
MAATHTDTAYAKLNLALHVRARREDGYHELETLFAFLNDGDRVQVRASDDLSLAVEGVFADGLNDGPDNLVLKAAATLRDKIGEARGAAFVLNKRLPIASGIGGGSADAAAALRLAAKLWDLDPAHPALMATARETGADVAACLLSKTCLGKGVGDDLAAVDLPELSGRAVLLINPLIACPTGPVFEGWDRQDKGPLDVTNWRRARNDLQDSAIRICPEILEILTVLKAQLPEAARMSGSGATCFAVFSSATLCEAAMRRIATDHPDWWLMMGSLR